MTTRTPPSPLPTEKLLGPWSLTALAALLVVGGILVMVPGQPSATYAEGGANSMHPQGLTTTREARPKDPAEPAGGRPATVAVRGPDESAAGAGANANPATSDGTQGSSSKLTAPDR